VLAACKPRMAVMHPLPRVGEIEEAVDADPRAAYFRQMRCGLFLRMALLALLGGVTEAQAAAAAGGA
jgi:aspartate carbamoyltransferase catalytic subunit